MFDGRSAAGFAFLGLTHWPFRWIFAGVLAVMFVVGLFHRIRSITDEPLDRRQEGWIMLALRLPAVLFFVLVAAYLIHPPWVAWSTMPVPPAARWSGVALLLVWAALTTWTFRSLGRNLTDTVVTRRDHQLVTSGPYRWVRHPFYLAFGIGITAFSLVMANWLVLLLGLIALVMLVLRTPIEEQKLIDRFGDQYLRYMQTTGQFVPWIGKRRG